MSLISYHLDVNEFLSKYSQSKIIPIINTKEIKHLLKDKNIFVSEIYVEPNKDPYFFLDIINNIKKNHICFVINYTIYKSDLVMLTENYKGEIFVEKNNENRVYLEVNNTLADISSNLDWFDIWGHACHGWVMNNKAYDLFKKFLNTSMLLENDIINFLDNLQFKFEFGDVHESIRFISLNDELKNLLHENDIK